jgi:hypothetical protein
MSPSLVSAEACGNDFSKGYGLINSIHLASHISSRPTRARTLWSQQTTPQQVKICVCDNLRFGEFKKTTSKKTNNKKQINKQTNERKHECAVDTAHTYPRCRKYRTSNDARVGRGNLKTHHRTNGHARDVQTALVDAEVVLVVHGDERYNTRHACSEQTPAMRV